MKLSWHITKNDIALVKTMVARYRDHPIVYDRISRNLSASKPLVTKERFWKTLVMALLTTQQPSGPKSAVIRILETSPFLLSYNNCLTSKNIAEFAAQTLIDFGGIRRHGVIGSELSTNLEKLESQLWPKLLEMLNNLRTATDQSTERMTADFLALNMKGLGPKQARNLLQALGLTRYEMPIDSRVVKWLKIAKFPVPLNPTALSDRDYYCFVLDGIQDLCNAAKEFPCVLDGAIFASFDAEKWDDGIIVF